MKARGTGDFRSVNLNLDANLKKYGAKKKKSSTTTDTETTTPSGDTGKSESGSTTNPGSGSEGDGLPMVPYPDSSIVTASDSTRIPSASKSNEFS